MKHIGQPTVILAKTVKGYGMGEAGEGQNITHSQKKMGEESLRDGIAGVLHVPRRRARLEHLRPQADQPLTGLGRQPGAELRVGDYSVSVRVLGPEHWPDADGNAILVLLDRLQLTVDTMEESELRSTCVRLQEELTETRTLRERLVSVWAHELKTPLTVVQSYLEILTDDLDDGLSQEQLSFLTITKESVHRLRRLVLDLVDLIGFRTGHLSVETTTVDVDALLDEIIEEMRTQIR